MNIRLPATGGLRLKLRIVSDGGLWGFFVHHREECSQEFWEEVENRKAAGTLSKDSPFWTMGKSGRYFHTPNSRDNSNLIELTSEEWEARKRRKMFRLVSA